MHTKYYNVSERIIKVLSGSVTILAMLTALVSTFSCSPVPENGEIKEFFFFDEDNIPQLTVWFSFSRGGGRSVTIIKEHLKTYDLQTGNVLGSVILSSDLHYKLFFSNSTKAWGYCKQAGIQLLDLVKPEIIATEQELLKHNPHLGEKVKLYLRNVYDPITNSLHVAAVDKQVYRLDVDLNTGILDHIPDRIYPEKKELVFARDWHFYNVEHHLGKHLHTNNAECSDKSVTLLEPELIKEFNEDIWQKDKVWVIHKSAIYGEYDLLLSLIVPNGEELVRLNFQKIFKKNKKPRVLGTYTRDKEVMVFFDSGNANQNSIEGFSFIALRTDAESGKLVGQINYF